MKAEREAGYAGSSGSYYTDFVRSEGGGRPERPEEAVRTRPGTIGVGIFGPIVEVGGVQTWIEALHAAADPARITWLGVGVRNESDSYPAPALDRLRELSPLVMGLSGCRALAARCDVALTWCWPDLGTLLDDLPRVPKVIACAHASAARPENVAAVPTGRVDRYVAVSPSALETVPAPARPNARIIRNGLDSDRVAPSVPRAELLRTAGLADPARRVVLYLGRLSPEKNPAAVVAALIELESREPGRWAGSLVGRGPELDALRDRAAAAPVLLPGATGDVGSWLAAADYCVLPSHEEACAFSLIEYWLAGRPALATPVGVAAEHPGWVRLLPRPATGADLADAILADVADPAGTASRVRAANAGALASYGLARFGREWTAELLAAAGRDPGPELPTLSNPFHEPLASLDGLTPSEFLRSLSQSAMRAIRECPHREERTGCCGGTAPFCRLGKGQAGWVDSLACGVCVTRSGQ